MIESKKAASGGQTGSGGGQMNISDVFDSPRINYSIPFEPGQGTIAELLHTGSQNAITAAQLAGITGQTARDVTRRIMYERRNGAPIMSCQGGFFLAETTDELRRCVAALHARAGQIHQTARALEETAEAAEVRS